MGMRFARRIARRVLVLVVLIVVVEMFVFQRLMDVLVFVSLGDVQPDADEHENARSAERPIEAALSDCEGERGACKRGGGEIGVPTASGQKTTLSHYGIGPSQRAKAFAMEFPFNVEAILAVGVDVRVARRRQMHHITIIDVMVFRSELI